MTFGERFSELRKDRGIKQKEIAAQLNVAVSTVSNYETDSHEPDLNNLCKVADILGVSTDYLLGRTDIPNDINDLKETVYQSITKADVINMMEQFSREDCAYLAKTLRLLYYYSNLRNAQKKENESFQE